MAPLSPPMTVDVGSAAFPSPHGLQPALEMRGAVFDTLKDQYDILPGY